MTPKYKDNNTQKNKVIYKCDRLESDEEYIVETARTSGESLKEHLEAPCPIYDYANTQVIIPNWTVFPLW